MNKILGRRFGRLLAVKYAPGARMECVCDCGTSKTVYKASLVSGRTRSCGCLNREALAARGPRTHGGTYTPEYKVWQGMHQRCGNENDKSFADYGGRGIKVCDAWQAFEQFLEDMGERPSGEHSLDRINVNGGYEPKNCRWVTHAEQQRNKRNSIIACGVSLSEIFDSHSAAYQRARKLIKGGANPDDAVRQCL